MVTLNDFEYIKLKTSGYYELQTDKYICTIESQLFGDIALKLWDKYNGYENNLLLMISHIQDLKTILACLNTFLDSYKF